MKRNARRLAMAVAGPLLLSLELAPESLLPLKFRDSLAIVGAPMTPLSVAGVARRTTRRVAVVEASAASSATAQQQAATAQQQQAVARQQAETAQQQAAVAQQQAAASGHHPALGTVVTTLPPGCVQTAINGVEYSRCSGVYYRAGFQGNNLVYVVEQP
jgi:hypothetical protein